MKAVARPRQCLAEIYSQRKIFFVLKNNVAFLLRASNL